jgi:beta-lactamase regulating signal transducer with metallopeptidase domain
MNSFIENLNQWGGVLLSFAWPMLWQSSLLIVILLMVDFSSRGKIRASIRYALWLVVLLKLCLPPTLALPTGAAWWLFPNQAAVRPPHIPKYAVTYDTTAPLADFVPETIPMPVPPPPKLTGAGWLLSGCGFVSASLLVWLALRWWQISRKVSGATQSEEFAGLLDEIRCRTGLRSPPQLKLVPGRMSPAVCGLCRPVILLPQVLAERLSAAQLRAVLLHEAFHLRRKDVWVNCAQALLQIAYWWHPLLWLANARIRRLREEAVDDAVMLALQSEAENYAPTLLTVAKLALSRPLMSLGLVGIMESRTALRKRIERLVNFRPVRKAGLSFLSFCCIFTFSAVALPMGEAPAPAPASNTTDATTVEPQSLTLRVDPGIFIQNVKAQAAKSLLSSTNDYTAILLDILRGEGVDCGPSNGIAFNTRTGEITTQNTPARLEIFRRVIEQLNRADGMCELPLGNNPLRKNVVIEARIYQTPSADFDKFVSGLPFYHGRLYGDDWWSASPEKFGDLVENLQSSGLQSSGLQLIQRPRIQTASGITAEFFVGNGTNSVEFDCEPIAADGAVDLKVRGTVVGGPAGAAVTNYFHTEASAEDHGGIVVRVKNYGGDPDHSLLAAISVEIVTNAVHFQERLQTTIGPGNSTVTVPRASGPAQLVPGAGGAGSSPGFSERMRVTIPDKAASANGLVRDAKLLYEMGKFDQAEKSLQSALTLEPDNQAAHYYLNLVQTAKANRGRGMIQTPAARKAIVDKLNRIQFDQFGPYIRRPLSEVVQELNQLTTGLASDKTGIHFFTADSSDARQPVIDPNTGLPAEGAGSKGVDIDSVTVSFSRALTNLTLANVLDAIVMAANKPIKYSVSDEGIVFSFKDNFEAPQLYARTFRVNTSVFLVNLQKQVGIGTNVAFALRRLFLIAGVDMSPPESVFYNDRLGLLFVRATMHDLDSIEKVIQTLNQAMPQIHIKARFLEVPGGTSDGIGAAKIIGSTNQPDQFAGILTSESAKVALKSLESRPGAEILAEPEVTTSSGRQTQMRSTQIISVITNFGYQEISNVSAVFPQTSRVEKGPILDVIPTVSSDGYTIDLRTVASLAEFLGYDNTTNTAAVYNKSGEKIDLPTISPSFVVREANAHIKLWDRQTVVLGPLKTRFYEGGKEVGAEPDYFVKTSAARGRRNEQDREVYVFITVTLVDAAGNRIHSDGEMPFAKNAIPPQDGL